MTEGDRLLLKAIADGAKEPQWTQWALHQRDAQLDLLRLHLGHKRLDSLSNAVLRELLTRESEFLDLVACQVRELVRKAELDPAARNRLLEYRNPEAVVRNIASSVWFVPLSSVLKKALLSAFSPLATSDPVAASGLATRENSADADARNRSAAIGNGTKHGQKILPEIAALDREQFTEEEIRQCLLDLQELDHPSGPELADFISELERAVNDP